MIKGDGALERRCYSFLQFAHRIDAGRGRLVLEITGGEGVRAFIAAQFGLGHPLIAKEAP